MEMMELPLVTTGLYWGLRDEAMRTIKPSSLRITYCQLVILRPEPFLFEAPNVKLPIITTIIGDNLMFGTWIEGAQGLKLLQKPCNFAPRTAQRLPVPGPESKIIQFYVKRLLAQGSKGKISNLYQENW